MSILETERLTLRHLSPDADAEFILRLLNEPSFLQYVGDKGARSLDDARAYIRNGPAKSYAENGFGLYRVGLRGDDAPIGICGLIKRDSLPDPDIGFALLPEYWKKGYAYESADAVMRHARDVLQFKRILAITTADNHASGKLLEKIGLKFERLIRLSDEADEVKLFSTPIIDDLSELPIACELSPAELEARRQALLSRLLAQATESIPLANGFRWRFAPSTEVLIEAVKAIDAERQCCRFLKFALTVEPDAGDVWLEVTGPDGTKEFISTLLNQ